MTPAGHVFLFEGGVSSFVHPWISHRTPLRCRYMLVMEYNCLTVRRPCVWSCMNSRTPTPMRVFLRPWPNTWPSRICLMHSEAIFLSLFRRLLRQNSQVRLCGSSGWQVMRVISWWVELSRGAEPFRYVKCIRFSWDTQSSCLSIWVWTRAWLMGFRRGRWVELLRRGRTCHDHQCKERARVSWRTTYDSQPFPASPSDVLMWTLLNCQPFVR